MGGISMGVVSLARKLSNLAQAAAEWQSRFGDGRA
jgi:hypothetical protein